MPADVAYRDVMRAALLAITLLAVAGCHDPVAACHDSDVRTFDLHDGVVKWQDRDTVPNQYYTMRGDLTVEISAEWVHVTKGAEQLVIPRQRVVHIGSNTDPDRWH
jgi:hypothetical protein